MIKIELIWKKLKRDEQIISASKAIRVQLMDKVKDDETVTILPSYITPFISCNNSGNSFLIINTPEEGNNYAIDENGLLKEETNNVKIVLALYSILHDNTEIQSFSIVDTKDNEEALYILNNKLLGYTQY